MPKPGKRSAAHVGFVQAACPFLSGHVPHTSRRHRLPCASSHRAKRVLPAVTTWRAQSNIDGDLSEREAEIAAKIAKLKKMNMINRRPQDGDREQDTEANATNTDTDINSDPNESSKSTPNSTRSVPTTFADLPDWKKEQVLLREMENAESFLGTSKPSEPTTTSTPSGDTPETYKPKVKTWGVFPRPDNISKAYGGGRAIPRGGVQLNSNDAESAEKDRKIRERLAEYRKQVGIDMEKEEKHAEEIAQALSVAEKLSREGAMYPAVRKLEEVKDFVSPRSRRGGQVYMALALAYEGTGQRTKAREIYIKLRQSPFEEFSRQARQLMSGLDAMENLGVDDEAARTGLRVAPFELPELAAYTDKRYETVVGGALKDKPKRPANDGVESSDSGGNRNPSLLLALLVISLLAAGVWVIGTRFVGSA